MADNQNDIKSISISVTARTKEATDKLNALLGILDTLQKTAKSISLPSKSISQFANSLEKISQINLNGLSRKLVAISNAFQKMNFNGIDTKALNAEAKLLNAQAKLQNAKVKQKAVDVQKTKAALTQQRLTIAQQNANTAAAKQARLSQAMQLGANARASRAGTAAAGQTSSGDESWLSKWKKKWGIQEEQKSSGDESWLSAWQKKWGMNSNWQNISDLKKAEDAAAALKERMKSSIWTAIAAAIAKLANTIISKLVPAIKQASVWMLKLIGSMIAAPFKRMTSSISGAIKKLSVFLAAVKRIAVYRAIRWALKEITQAFKEGIDNLYQYSKAIDGVFAKSMDTLATSALYAKNSLAAMVSPLINALAPAIDMIVDKFVDFINVVNELIASLTGAATWTKALKYPKEYAEAMDDANGSAKKLRATLLGFDEINRLDDNNKGSRGKAGDALDYTKMFEEKNVTRKVNKFVEAIKKAFKSGDFSEIGKSIGEKLKKGLDKIPWNSIKDRVEKNATSVATLINGFIDVPGLGESIGKSIAEAFNTAVLKIKTFFNTVKWGKVGEFLGDGINGILKTFDTRELGRAIASIINGGVELLDGFINEVKWEEFGTFLSDGINSFFDDINTRKLGETISNAVRNAAKLVHTFFEKTDFEKIGERIGELIKSLDWVGILKDLGQILLDALKAAIQTCWGLIKEDPAFALIIGTLVANKIAVALGAPSVISTIATALKGAIAGTSIGSAAGGALSGASAAGVGAAAGKAGAVIGTAAAGYMLGNAIYENVEPVQEFADNLVAAAAEEISLNPLKNLKTLIRGYASGGTPDTGSLFLAGEAGAEIISSKGSHTTVSNRDQIAESVAVGNEEGNALLRELVNVGRSILAKDNTTVAYISTDSIVSGLDRKNRRDGRASVPVGV